MDDVSILCQKTLISGKNRLIDILSQKNSVVRKHKNELFM